MTMEADNTLDLIKCTDCDIQFSNLKAFQLHVDDQHIKQEIDDVHGRQTSLESQKRRKNHKTKVRPPNTAVFTCKLCTYVAKSEHLLQKHVETKHNPKRKIFSCHICEYFCLQERTFKLHQLRHSEQDAKFACDQCGKLFLSMVIMKRHALTHNKLKPFVCHVEGCDRRFNIKSRLTDHIRYIHNKRSSCDPSACNKGVSTTNDFAKGSHNDFNLPEVKKQLPRKIQEKVFGISIPDEKDPDSCNTSKMNVPSIPPKLIHESTESKCFSRKSERRKSCGHADKKLTNEEPIIVYDIILFEYKDGQKYSSSFNALSRKDGIAYSTTTATTTKTGSISSDSTPTVQTTCVPSNSNIEYETIINAFKKNATSKFTCSWAGCGKSFRDRYNFRMHTCTHTGEMQRACKLCGYTCVQKSALDRHMKVHERLNP